MWGITALRVAALNYDQQMVQLLFAYGADEHQLDEWGDPPLKIRIPQPKYTFD
jgi:hypothetical protein